MGNFKTVKSLEECKLQGISFEWEKIDNQVRTVTLKDCDGNVVSFGKPDGYSSTISVLVPAPPVMEDRWVLHGTVSGIEIKKAFTEKHEAEDAKSGFNGAGDALIIDKLSMPVDDRGEVNASDLDIPF